MTYAYFVDNENNGVLFRYIQALGIAEDNVIVDSCNERVEIKRLFQQLKKGDILIVKSIIALGDNITQVLNALGWLDTHKVELISVLEEYFKLAEYQKFIADLIVFDSELNEKARTLGYEKALAAKKVGRPKNNQVAEALRLYDSKKMTTEQIQKVTGVSTSTLYRAVRDRIKKQNH